MSITPAIIQLISEQTLQNVLPILALRPRKVVSVVSSATESFAKTALQVKRAVELADAFAPSMEPVTFLPDLVSVGNVSPTIEQTREIVARALVQHGGAAVNYTGGTKEMAIGAWLAAQDAGALRMYCDTPREFRPPGAFAVSLPDLARRLRVEVILAAQGFDEGSKWKYSPLSQARENFGKAAHAFQRDSQQAWWYLRSTVREHGTQGRSRPSAADVARVEEEPLPRPTTDGGRQVLDGAVSCGFLVRRGVDYFFNVPPKPPMKVRVQLLADATNGIDGGAFEGRVQEALRRSRRFSHFIHGVEPVGATTRADFGESDFLAFDPALLSLTLISCKSSPPSLEHLESVVSRKEKLGGRFAKGLLCVESVGGRKVDDLRKQLAGLGLELAIGDEIENVFQCEPEPAVCAR